MIQAVKRKEPGRNDDCPCGSGEKYKKCCLKKIEFADSKIDLTTMLQLLYCLVRGLKSKKKKIGDKVYDGDNEPVMVILSKKDKQNIADMPEDKTKYASFPDGFSDLEWHRFPVPETYK